jgi:hypothetical protein
MAGYSSTPLWKKLGYKAGLSAFVPGAPPGYAGLLLLPAGVRVTWLARAGRGMGFVHLFALDAAVLHRRLATLRRQIAPDGVIWVSWPKQSSGVTTDISEDTIRAIALPLGLVDIKVCAVDATWSGLKFMIRKTER